MGNHTSAYTVAAIISQAKRRGYVVPPHLRAKYKELRTSKSMTAHEAAKALGIMNEDGTVKKKFLPPSPSGLISKGIDVKKPSKR